MKNEVQRGLELAAILPRWNGSEEACTRHPSRACEAKGCLNSTRSGKPFCSEHVTMHGYVEKLVKEIERQKTEIEKAKKGKGNPDGFVAREIVTHLTMHGDRTIERLSRELNVDLDVLELVVASMASKRLVSTSLNRRGYQIVRLAG